MPNLMGLTSIVSELKAERTNLVTQLQRIDAALAALTMLNGDGANVRAKRNVSAAARRSMSAAQKARWAKSNGTAQSNGRSKRTMSASARKRIAAAQRARWAKVRSEQKKAA